jgi:DegV family protein with EDD domain
MIIVSDSGADLGHDEVEEMGIIIAPLQIHFPEGCISSEEISADDFYSRLKAMEPHIPSSSQPSAGVFAGIYQKLTDLKEEIMSIHISSGLSGTIESARVGASHVLGAKIDFVDTKTLSGGERFQVIAAALASKAGWGKEAILERLKAISEQTEVVYTLETLTYLARGGRIGRVQALAGSILGLKPIIKVDKKDGKYTTVGKERTLQRSMESIRDYLLKIYGPSTPLRVSVMHGQFSEHANELANMLQEKLNVAQLEILRISPVLGVHTGPGVVGAAVVPKALMEGF